MRKLAVIALFSVSNLSFAAAPVEELGSGEPPIQSVRTVSPAAPYGSAPRAPAAAPAAPAVSPQNKLLTDLHYELQALREEVREMRGMLEEQGNELNQLRQRQQDDYQDLDSRLGAGSAGGVGSAAPARPSSAPSTMTGAPAAARSTPPATAAEPFGASESGGYEEAAESPIAAESVGSEDAIPQFESSDSPPQAGQSQPSEGEYEAYQAAYNLLKARKIDEAIAAFTVFVAKFPNSTYTANSYYWLGEIYVLQNNLKDAASSFAMVSNKFPDHRKALDAKFKLAKVYHMQGENAKAKQLLTEVAATNSSAAALAKAYLSDNF